LQKLPIRDTLGMRESQAREILADRSEILQVRPRDLERWVPKYQALSPRKEDQL
jgi:hypothetical protein